MELKESFLNWINNRHYPYKKDVVKGDRAGEKEFNTLERGKMWSNHLT